MMAFVQKTNDDNDELNLFQTFIDKNTGDGFDSTIYIEKPPVCFSFE